MQNIYDLVIIGAGPAGFSASIYASRYKIDHLMVGTVLGGQANDAHKIDNYPGIEDVSGFDLAKKMEAHAKKYGVEILPKTVRKIMKKEKSFSIEMEDKTILAAKVVILAVGAKKRKLNITGEEEFFGRGVSYCAVCDGFFYKGKTVGVIGGSDSAAGAAVYLADLCKKVYIIYRQKELRAEPIWKKEIEKKENIELILETNVVEIAGSEKLEKVKLDRKYNGVDEISLDGLFIEAGSDPSIDFSKDLNLETDEGGYIKIKSNGETNVAGVFAAGDITTGSDKFRQIIIAAAEGAIAARGVYNFLKGANIDK